MAHNPHSSEISGQKIAGRYSHGSHKTCQNCARAKIRCVRPEGASCCQRCDRLGKDCQFRDKRGMNTGKPRNTDRRVEELEAKVDQLLARSITPVQQQSSSLSDGATDHSSPQSGDVIDQGLLTMEAAITLLHKFQTYLMPYCPFVVVSQNTSADTLRREKPFLFLCILTAAMHDNLNLQRKLEAEVKRTIAKRMIFDGRVSFETLQGLLVHLAWCQYHSRPRRFSQYLHLATSIITDLQLDRAPDLRFWRSRVNFDPDVDPGSDSWGHEEQRALVGCFYFTSNVSHILQKQSFFPYLPYIEHCCDSLAASNEHASDRYLRHLIRLQCIWEKITTISTQHLSQTHVPGFGMENHFRQLRTELQTYRDELPFPLHENYMLLMQFHTAELYLCQVSLFDHKPNTEDQQHPLRFQVEALCMGLVAAKSLLDFYTSLPLGTETAFNNASWVQLGFGLTVACKLTVASSQPLIHPHTAGLSAALDLSNVLRRCILRLQALITSEMDESGDRDVFYHYEQRIKRLQWWFENRSLSGPGKNPIEVPSLSLPASSVAPSSTQDLTGSLDMAWPSLDEISGYGVCISNVYDLQWPGFFPGASIDDSFGDGWGQGNPWPGEQGM